MQSRILWHQSSFWKKECDGQKEHVKSYGQSAATTACICKTADIEGFNRICNNGLLIQSMWCAELIREILVFHNLVMHMKQRAENSKDYLTNIL